MTTLVVIVHVLVSFFLITVVLLQSSKGAEMGAAFGGSSQTLFGSRGAATFLSKITTIAAVVFMVTSLILAVLSVQSGSVIKPVAPVGQKAPQAPLPPLSPQGGPVQAPAQQTVPAAPQK